MGSGLSGVGSKGLAKIIHTLVSSNDSRLTTPDYLGSLLYALCSVLSAPLVKFTSSAFALQAEPSFGPLIILYSILHFIEFIPRTECSIQLSKSETC